MNSSSSDSQPFVSVIVPVLNNKIGLRLCCQALVNQSYPQDRYEVIIIDNGSSDGTLSVQAEFEDFIFSSESQVGSYAARNKGIELAKGSVLAFTDSDCIPEANWISEGISFLANHPDVSAIGGAIKFIFSSDLPNIYEIYDSLFRLNQQHYLNNFNFAATANFFIWKDVINKLGRFNSSLKSGGDIELCHRLLDSRLLISYAPRALINHPAQNSLIQIVKREIHYCRGLSGIKTGYNSKFNSDFLLNKRILSISHPIRIVFSSSNSGVCECLALLLIGAINKFVYIFERIRLSLSGRDLSD